MKSTHLDEESLKRLIRDTDSPEARQILLHALAVCPECYRVGGYLLDAHRSGELPLMFSAVEADLALSRAQAPGLWEQLRTYSFEKQCGLIEDHDRYVTWGLCELLARESRKVGLEDPSKAVEMAKLAVLIAKRLQPGEPAEEEWLDELCSYAWAFLGNAFRVLGELLTAGEAFGEADRLWERGASEIGDPLGYGPIILDLKASLRRGQRRFDEALGLLDRIVTHYRSDESRDLHLAGRGLVNKSYVFDQMGEPERALAILEEAGTLIDRERDPRLFLCVRHNVLWSLTTLGRFADAEPLLPEVEALSQQIGNRLDLIRLRWAEGRIEAGQGRLARGEALFREVREGFVAERIGYDAALVSLELATLYAEEGRAAELKELADEMMPIFQTQDIHREALAALTLFQQAAAREEASLDLVRRITRFLERARYDPELTLDES